MEYIDKLYEDIINLNEGNMKQIKELIEKDQFAKSLFIIVGRAIDSPLRDKIYNIGQYLYSRKPDIKINKELEDIIIKDDEREFARVIANYVSKNSNPYKSPNVIVNHIIFHGAIKCFDIINNLYRIEREGIIDKREYFLVITRNHAMLKHLESKNMISYSKLLDSEIKFHNKEYVDYILSNNLLNKTQIEKAVSSSIVYGNIYAFRKLIEYGIRNGLEMKTITITTALYKEGFVMIEYLSRNGFTIKTISPFMFTSLFDYQLEYVSFESFKNVVESVKPKDFITCLSCLTNVKFCSLSKQTIYEQTLVQKKFNSIDVEKKFNFIVQYFNPENIVKKYDFMKFTPYFIGMIDDDSYWILNQLVELFKNKLQNNKSGIIYSQFCFINTNTKLNKKFKERFLEYIEKLKSIGYQITILDYETIMAAKELFNKI